MGKKYTKAEANALALSGASRQLPQRGSQGRGGQALASPFGRGVTVR